MTSEERALIRHDAARIEEKLGRLRLVLECDSAGSVAEYAEEIREIAVEIRAVADGAIAREERGQAA